MRQFDLPKLPLPPFPPSSFQGRRRGEEEIPLPFFQKSFMGSGEGGSSGGGDRGFFIRADAKGGVGGAA